MVILRFFLPFVLLLTLVISPLLARSEVIEPLYFPADKNNLEVLPQGFSFNLMDDYRIQIGNLIVDTRQFNFSVTPSTAFKGQFQIHFTWPAALFKEGILTLRSGDNQTIFPLKIARKEILSAPTFRGGKENIHSEKAELIADNVEPEVIENMKQVQYVRLCLLRETPISHVESCSQDFVVKEQKDGVSVALRAMSKKKSQVKINDKAVRFDGELALHKRTDDLYFWAVNPYDAFVKIITHRQDVIFHDVVTTRDEKNVLLTFSGAEPTDEMGAKKISPALWQIILPVAHPSLYLKADGEVPMHQEFKVKGPLPKIGDRPYLDKNAVFKTYSSDLTLEGFTRDNWQAKAFDTSSTVEANGKNFFWHLHDIPEDQLSTGYLKVEQGNKKFVVEHNVFRGRPFELAVQSFYLIPSQSVSAQGHFQAWLDLHWGFMVEQTEHMSEKAGTTPLDLTTIKILWRVHPGLYKVDPDWGVALLGQNLKSKNLSSQAAGLGLFWFGQATSSLWHFMDGYHFSFDAYLPSYTGNSKITFAYEAKALIDSAISENVDFQYGLESRSYKFKNDAISQSDPLGFAAGFTWRF